MKKITVLLVLCQAILNAQEIKNQSEEIDKLKKGAYTAYLAQWDGNGNYSGGIDDTVYKVADINTYRIRENSPHKEVYLILRGSKTDAKKHKPLMFIPDNEAYPVTYMQRVYEGNKKMQEEIGYAPRTNVYEDTRAVFLDGKIYILNNWKSKDEYSLKAVLEFQEKKLGGLKMMKEVMKSPKKLKVDQPHQKLQTYLKEALKKQETVYANWIKNPENKAIVDNTKLINKLVNGAITKFNDDYKKSDVWKRIQENNRRAEASAAANDVTIKNSTGSDIYLYEEGSMNGKLIRSNSSGTLDCKTSYYYTFSHSSGTRHGAAGPLGYSANSSCGGTVTIN